MGGGGRLHLSASWTEAVSRGLSAKQYIFPLKVCQKAQETIRSLF